MDWLGHRSDLLGLTATSRGSGLSGNGFLVSVEFWKIYEVIYELSNGVMVKVTGGGWLRISNADFWG